LYLYGHGLGKYAARLHLRGDNRHGVAQVRRTLGLGSPADSSSADRGLGARCLLKLGRAGSSAISVVAVVSGTLGATTIMSQDVPGPSA
jgi:hypothetical protein